jgi:hypothetical protein
MSSGNSIEERKEIKKSLIELFVPHLKYLLDHYSINDFSEQYRVSAMICWGCGRPIPVFNWWPPEDVKLLYPEDPTLQIEIKMKPSGSGIDINGNNPSEPSERDGGGIELSDKRILARDIRNSTLMMPTPPNPRPNTIRWASGQWRRKRKSWLNHCPVLECGSKQAGSYIEDRIASYIPKYLSKFEQVVREHRELDESDESHAADLNLHEYFPSTGEPWYQIYLYFDVN